MIYLSAFYFPTYETEVEFITKIRRTCYNTFYPFDVLSKNDFVQIDFEPVTILYGGNGSGKSTALNVIGEKLGLHRNTLYNRTNFYEDYLRLCRYESEEDIPKDSRIITSDDVFDFMLNIRGMNGGIDIKREELFEDYLDAKYSKFQMKSLDDYEQLKKVNYARSKSQSHFVRDNLMGNIREQSNGESAFRYFEEKIREDALYLLDEPENSLSPERQLELLNFIEESVRLYGCQFVIATHSPFLLSMKGAKIYDLDEKPVDVKKWTELGNVKTYYDFFMKHMNEFED